MALGGRRSGVTLRRRGGAAGARYSGALRARQRRWGSIGGLADGASDAGPSGTLLARATGHTGRRSR